MASTIQIRVDDDLKSKSDSLFRELGTDTTSAIRMFLAQAVANNGFPFEIKRNLAAQDPYRAMSENKMMMKLEISRKHALEGKVKDADDVISDMREKYDL
ncbi:type II toxin-antitoxin system RelB/DinJ family antitoxin [Hespellia stercorisuis]|uniref:DNA-damage-inducible protein J n=1 Tax=Hespellia stercorisuis DSM 15480 TaxID=1121950 RepID=A0A1M6UNF8_9FIRM|nr:type II toxin-antitoxin system RelB/DinJ family antitoxin [Hespellia stercorisuis]SHK70690.1 DNA-damage-inducible protein J [Hespellia stercorisuis DSM 15480]